MQSATAQWPAVVLKPAEHIVRAQHVVLREFVDGVDALSESVARRAFEIFEARGRKDVEDLTD